MRQPSAVLNERETTMVQVEIMHYKNLEAIADEWIAHGDIFRRANEKQGRSKDLLLFVHSSMRYS